MTVANVNGPKTKDLSLYNTPSLSVSPEIDCKPSIGVPKWDREGLILELNDLFGKRVKDEFFSDCSVWAT